MRLVRVGGRYLEGRERRLWMALAAVVGLASAGVVVAAGMPGAGRIRCWGDDWSTDGYQRKSISRPVNSEACGVRHFLIERHPDLAFSALRWVESIIVFTHPLCRLEVNQPRATIVRYSQLF